MILPFQRRVNFMDPVAQEGNPNIEMPQIGGDTDIDFSQPLDNSPQQTAPMSFQDRLKALYDANSTGPAMKALQAHMAAVPREEKPSFARALASSLAGGIVGATQGASEGVKVGQGIIDQPFDRKMKHWEAEDKGLQGAAAIEDKNAKEKVALFNEADRQDKEAATERRNAGKDAIDADLKKAQIANYASLKKDRDSSGWTFHQNSITGELVGINPKTNETKNYGKVNLTPQQKIDLDVTKFGRESGITEGREKRVQTSGSELTEKREKGVHKENRLFDVNNPLPVRAPRDSYVSPQAQTVAYKQAAKELNIESKGAYSQYINTDGTIKGPDDLGGYFSSGDSEGLSQFYQLIKNRATDITNKSRKPQTESTATAPPKVKAPELDSRIMQ